MPVPLASAVLELDLYSNVLKNGHAHFRGTNRLGQSVASVARICPNYLSPERRTLPKPLSATMYPRKRLPSASSPCTVRTRGRAERS